MSRVHHAAADVQRRAHDAIGAEPFEREHGADDVDDRVERADLVQVHLSPGESGGWPPPLRRAGETAAWLEAALAADSAERSIKRADLGKAAMRVAMRNGCSRMCVRVRMLMACTIVGAVLFDDKLRRRYAGAQYPLRRHGCAVDRQASQRSRSSSIGRPASSSAPSTIRPMRR